VARVDLDDASLFGESDARLPVEQEGLRRYFLQPPGYADILLGRKLIIAGRKGMGKTAIRTKLLELTDSVVHVDIEPLVPNHRVFSLYAESVEGTSTASFATYEYAWRAYIVAAVLRHLVQNRLLGMSDRMRALAYVERLTGPTAKAQLWDRIREISVSFGDLLSVSASVDAPSVRRALPTETELPLLIEMLHRASEEARTRIIVLVDRVDQQLEEALKGELFYTYAKYVGGLCLAVARLASSVPPKRLSLYAFVREDLLDEVWPRLHNATEFEGLVHRLNWRMDHLMDMLALRISTATRQQYEVALPYDEKRERFFSGAMLYSVFDRIKLDQLGVWKYFLVHTHMRPRDLINICNACRKEAADSYKDIIDDASINRAMHIYSTQRYNDIHATYRWMISGLGPLLESFKPGPFARSRESLIQHIDQTVAAKSVEDVTCGNSSAEHLLRLLYRMGFLVTPATDDRLPYLAHYLEPHLRVDRRDRWLIHPAFIREIADGEAAPNIREYLGISRE
jgi:hypothetical protein